MPSSGTPPLLSCHQSTGVSFPWQLGLPGCLPLPFRRKRNGPSVPRLARVKQAVGPGTGADDKEAEQGHSEAAAVVSELVSFFLLCTPQDSIAKQVALTIDARGSVSFWRVPLWPFALVHWGHSCRKRTPNKGEERGQGAQARVGCHEAFFFSRCQLCMPSAVLAI